MVKFDQMWCIFQPHSPVFHTLLTLVLPHLDSRGIEALILILKKKILNCRYDSIISPILLPRRVFFHVEEQKIVRWCQMRIIWRVINQFKATVMHSSHCNHSHLCAGALSWWNRTPFISFPCYFRNVSSTTIQSPELLIQCGFIWMEIMQLVSGKVVN